MVSRFLFLGLLGLGLCLASITEAAPSATISGTYKVRISGFLGLFG